MMNLDVAVLNRMVCLYIIYFRRKADRTAENFVQLVIRHLVIASVSYQLMVKFISSTDFDQQIFLKLFFQRIMCLFVSASGRTFLECGSKLNIFGEEILRDGPEALFYLYSLIN